MMRLLYIPLIAFSIAFQGCSQHSENKKTATSAKKLPHDFMFMQRAYPTGEIKTTAYADAIRWKKQLAHRNSNDLLWEFSGPENIGGRITDIEIPSGMSETYYVGAASGGVFKTTDAGTNWNPIFDEQDMLSIGDIEISRNDNNLIWVGTGEVNAGGGSLAYDGDGIYKSSDGGITWETKGLPDVGSIGKILIDPTDDETIFVGAMGPLFRNDTNRGVYRSIDGGTTWEQKLFVSDSTGIIDMAIHPTNGDIIYASSWERIRRPDRRDYGGETSRIYRSLDGGENWIELTNGLPTDPSEKGRISIDISRSNPNVLFSRYALAEGGIQGVYKTVNGGDSWTEVNSDQLTSVGFHWWFRGIYIDPSDENILYNVDFVVEKSTDGGNTWNLAFPGVHVDQHALAFNESVAGEVLLGNDGGFYKSTNHGASSVKDQTLPITQFYRIHVDAQNSNKIYAGAQDNSTCRTIDGGVDDWSIIYAGDGFQPLVDPTNTNTVYALFQYGRLGKSFNNGTSFSSATFGISSEDRKNWDTPVTFDPANSQILFYGSHRMYKTVDATENWIAISPDLTNGPSGGNLIFGTITSISVSEIDSDIIYVGTDDSNVWITEDGGTNWNNVSASLPNRWVTKVLASRSDMNTFYVTFSGYRYGVDEGHVYMTTNNGQNWTDITNDLPDIPINDIVEDRYGNLFLATDIGVLVSGDSGNNWESLGINIPSVVVTDLHIHEGTEFLYAATYGRSSYKIDIAENILSTPTGNATEGIMVFPNPAFEYVTITLSTAQEGIVLLYDQLGRVVLQKPFVSSDEQMTLRLDGLSKGIYYVKIKDGENRFAKKLIVN